MISTLIIDDDINYIKYFINNIINQMNEIRISYIITAGKVAIDIIEKNTLDLIVIDLKMPNITGIEVIEKIKSMNLINLPKIVVISGELDLMYCAKNNYIISDIIYKNTDSKVIKNKLRKIINDIQMSINLENIKNEIVKKLINFGYNFKYKGTQYIYQSILYIYESNNMDLVENLEKNVYKYIAYKYSKSILNIKTNIINSTRLIQGKNETITPKFVITDILVNLTNV